MTCRNYWKALRILLHHGGYSSMKMCHFQELLRVLFRYSTETYEWEWINVTWGCNRLSVIEVFFGSTNKFEKYYNIYKNVLRLRRRCYTQTPWVTFSVVAWSRYALRFTKYFHKVFNAKCQTDIKDFKANSLWFFKPFLGLFLIWQFWHGFSKNRDTEVTFHNFPIDFLIVLVATMFHLLSNFPDR